MAFVDSLQQQRRIRSILAGRSRVAAHRVRHTCRGRENDRPKHEVRYWTQSLGISAERLQAAVGKVGNIAYDVRACLLSGREKEAPD